MAPPLRQAPPRWPYLPFSMMIENGAVRLYSIFPGAGATNTPTEYWFCAQRPVDSLLAGYIDRDSQ